MITYKRLVLLAAVAGLAITPLAAVCPPDAPTGDCVYVDVSVCPTVGSGTVGDPFEPVGPNKEARPAKQQRNRAGQGNTMSANPHDGT